MNRTYIWDLDGTLVDSYKVIVKHIQEVFKGYIGYNDDEVFERVTQTSVSDFFIKEGERFNLDLKMLYDTYQKLTSKVRGEDYSLIMHAKEILMALTDEGCKHYIYTHRGSSTYDILAHYDLDEYFEDVIASEQNFKRKPDGDALNHLINKYELDKNNTFYVGDRHLDVLCGIDAGIQTIYYNEKGHKHEQATYSVHDLIDIVKLKYT